MAIASVSSEAGGAFAGELEAFARSAYGVDVAAVSAGETGVLLQESACRTEPDRQRRQDTDKPRARPRTPTRTGVFPPMYKSKGSQVLPHDSKGYGTLALIFLLLAHKPLLFGLKVPTSDDILDPVFLLYTELGSCCYAKLRPVC